MESSKGIFAIKLYELEKQYSQMQSKLRIAQTASHEKIRQELAQMKDICEEEELQLQRSMECCHSPAIAALSGIQKEYAEKAKQLLAENLPYYMQNESNDAEESRAEAVSLYAEYAIDFATQSIHQALLAALSAMDLQMTLERKEHFNERN